jgi:hypothetical protein
MRFVSFLVFVTRGGRSEQAAFATRRRLAPDKGLTLAAQFWADDTAEHRLEVIDHPAEGASRVIVTRTASADVARKLVTVEMALPPLEQPGAHGLHLDVDGTRVTSQPIGVLVRDVRRRGQRSRYKGRGTLTAASVRADVAGAHLYHGAVFPLDRGKDVDGPAAGLWIAAYFRGFLPEHQGPHLFSVTDRCPEDGNEVLAVRYCDVTTQDHTMTLALDPIGRSGEHTLGLQIDGRHVGDLRVTI